MKIRNDFTLFYRVVPSGKRVVYYYAYDENGRRLHGRSTGETTMTAARVKCNRLFKAGDLVPKKDYVPTFAEYAKGWWDWDVCEYLRKRRKRHALTRGYADVSKKYLENVILPYFGKMKMDEITSGDVERFLDYMTGEKKYKHATANRYYGTLQTMLNEAVCRGVIAKNPAEHINKLRVGKKAIRIVTGLEFKKLFIGDWQRVWGDCPIGYTANKLAAVTGMRIGEVLGLKGCYVFDEHIYVCKQYDNYGYRDTKTKDTKNIPLPALMIEELKELKKINGEGFVFSSNGGAKPVAKVTLMRYLKSALQKIGVSKDEIKERQLCFHGWRHFFNTELLKGGLTIPQAQAITGHKSERMTELYNHFDPCEFLKAREIQDELLRPSNETREEAVNADPDLKVLPFNASA